MFVKSRIFFKFIILVSASVVSVRCRHVMFYICFSDICDICCRSVSSVTTRSACQHILTSTTQCRVPRSTCFTMSGHSKSSASHTMMTSSRSDISDANFTSRISLNINMRTNTRKKLYKCDTCRAQLASRIALMLHFRNHTGEKPFKCDTCGSQFGQSRSLRRHMRTHTGEKPFKCDTCGLQFAQTGLLKSHHIHSFWWSRSLKRYLCTKH